MEKKENVATNAKSKTKTYTVYQSKYSYGYLVADTDDFRPDRDTHEYFEAEDGAEWYGVVVMSIFASKHAIESEGYDMDDVEKMDDDEMLEMLKDVLPEERFYDWQDNIAYIDECDEDYEPDYIHGNENTVDYKGVYVNCELKYKFTLDGGEVKSEIVW